MPGCFCYDSSKSLVSCTQKVYPSKRIIDPEGRIALAKEVQTHLGVQPGDEVLLENHSALLAFLALQQSSNPAIVPADAWRLLQENVISHAKIVTVSVGDYVDLQKKLSQRGISGGAVYEAIIAKAAELARVDRLLTINETHFHTVWQGGAGKIISPLVIEAPGKL